MIVHYKWRFTIGVGSMHVHGTIRVSGYNVITDDQSMALQASLDILGD